MKPLLLMALVCAPASAAVVGEWRVNLLKSGVTQETLKASTEAAAWLACQAKIPNAATTPTVYTCQTPRYVATVGPNPTPTPTPTPTPVPTPTPTPTPTATQVLYTDMSHAPLGAPITVCGRNFGATPAVKIGGIAASVLAKASLNPLVECIRAQLTAGGVVEVNGVAGPSVAIQPGDTLYVSLTGNDSTAVKNDAARPWRHLQTASAEASGAWGAAKPGDIIVLRGGTYSDSAVDGAFARLWRQGGTAPTGAKSTGYITITSYPGESVTINAPRGGGIDGGGTEAPQARYIAISNLTIVGNPGAASDGAPINLQTQGDYWRVVNNDVSWPAAPGGMKAGGIVGHGSNAKLLGNYVHDIAGGTENHGIYLDGADGIEVAWNVIQRVVSGNLFQTYDAWSTAGLTNLNVHNNLLEHGGRYDLNLSEQTVSGTFIHNTINDTALAGVRISINNDHTVALTLAENSGTGWNMKGSSSSEGAVNCDWNLTKGSAVIRDSKIVAGAGAKSYYHEDGTCSVLQFSNVVWNGLAGKVGP